MFGAIRLLTPARKVGVGGNVDVAQGSASNSDIPYVAPRCKPLDKGEGSEAQMAGIDTTRCGSYRSISSRAEDSRGFLNGRRFKTYAEGH